MLYHWYEFGHAALSPARAAADSCKFILDNPLNPISQTALGRTAAAACEVFERTTRRYAKPEFGIYETEVQGFNESVAVHEEVVWEKDFCRVLKFQKELPETVQKDTSRLLIVAPMSGHHATLLRGTVKEMLKSHEVYITDWLDASTVPLSRGAFDLDDYIQYMIEIFNLFEGDVHVLAVCQPSVPVLSAISIMEANKNKNTPHSMILMGAPIDTRINQTAVNNLAEERGRDWFENNVITNVPWSHSGAGRSVYPGFLQLTGFMTMNLDRHVSAHEDLFWNLVKGDGDSADKHRTFYDEYLAVMDLTAEFYLQTVDNVFIRHTLAQGEMKYRDQLIEPKAIENVGLLTIEGEKDDICGLGQCEAAHTLCTRIPEANKTHYIQEGVGHYGIFNGSRFRNEIAPLMTKYINHFQKMSGARGRELEVLY